VQVFFGGCLCRSPGPKKPPLTKPPGGNFIKPPGKRGDPLSCPGGKKKLLKDLWGAWEEKKGGGTTPGKLKRYSERWMGDPHHPKGELKRLQLDMNLPGEGVLNQEISAVQLKPFGVRGFQKRTTRRELRWGGGCYGGDERL